MAKLTAEEREILINALVENEAIEEDDREIYEGLKDAKLIAFADTVLNADEDAEEEDEDEEDDETEDIVDNEESDDEIEDDDDDEDFEDEEADEEEDEEPATNAHVCNMCAGKMKGKKGKKAPAQEEEEEMTENMTTEEWMNSAPPEIAEVVANAMKFANDEKAKLIEQLTANSSGAAKAKAVKLFAQHSLEDLRAIAPALTQNAQRATVTHVPGMQARSFSGAASPGMTTNRNKKPATESQPLVMPTLNWKEVSDEFAGNN